jgi:hypothetical protein
MGKLPVVLATVNLLFLGRLRRFPAKELAKIRAMIFVCFRFIWHVNRFSFYRWEFLRHCLDIVRDTILRQAAHAHQTLDNRLVLHRTNNDPTYPRILSYVL